MTRLWSFKMPAIVELRKNLYRVVRSEDGRLIRHENGKPIDGGGHKTKKKAVSQVCKINTSLQLRDSLIKEKTVELALESADRSRLPDSSFALVSPGGEIDDSGRTVPRSNRKLPYRNVDGSVMIENAYAAIAALNGARDGVDATKEQKDRAWNKIIAAIREKFLDYNPPNKMF